MKAIMRDEREMKDSGIEWIEDIPINWKIAKIRNVIQPGKDGIKIGPFGSALTNKTSGDAEYKIYGQANLVSGDFSDTKNKISKEIFIELQNYEVIPGDICISMMGTIGKCLTVPYGISKGIMDSHLIKIRLKETVDNRFFEYVYDKDKGGICFTQMQYEKKGSIMDGLNTTIVKGLYLPLPNLEEQQVIADYLDDHCSKIDAIIAEAKASIEEYQELKQAVIYEALTKGLNKNVPMKNSGIKWIGKTPINWEVTQLKRYIDILPGYAFSSDDFAKDGIPLLRGINVTPNGTRWDDVVYWNQSIDDNLLPYMLKAGDIVVGLDRPWISDGTRAIIVKEADLPCLLLQRVCRIRVSSNVDYRFVYYWLIGKSFENALTSDTTGISVPHISTNQIGNFIISFPSLSEQILICDYVDKKVRGISSLISEKQSLIEDLEAYKKSLIYEVVTGKRKVVA